MEEVLKKKLENQMHRDYPLDKEGIRRFIISTFLQNPTCCIRFLPIKHKEAEGASEGRSTNSYTYFYYVFYMSFGQLPSFLNSLGFDVVYPKLMDRDPIYTISLNRYSTSIF